MPKPTKAKKKAQLAKVKKQKQEPEQPGITSKKSYWVVLTVVMAVVVAVLGLIVNLSMVNNALLMVAIVVVIGLMGYVRVSPSNLTKSKRATFLFVGASIIGFSIWAAIILILQGTGFLQQIADSTGDQFFIIPSLIICLAVGAFAGELIGRNVRVQEFLFKPK